MRWRFAATFCLGLAACAAEAPQAPPAVGPRPDVLAAPRQGLAEFTVRTVAQARSGADVEVAGVDCTASSGGAVTRFRSPAQVAIIDDGSGVRVACAGGGRQGMALVQARPEYRATGWRAAPSIGVGIGSGGGWGLGLGAGVSPVRTVAGVGYDDVRVVLR